MNKLFKHLLNFRFFKFAVFANLSFLLLYGSFGIVIHNENKMQIQQAVEELKRESEQLLISTQNSGHYISTRLRDIFWKNWNDTEALKMRTSEFLDEIGINARIIIWDKTLEVRHCNFAYHERQSEWQQALRFFFDYRIRRKYPRIKDYPKEELINVRNLLGNMFFPGQMFRCNSPDNPELAITSFSSAHDQLWLYVYENGGMILFFPPEQLHDFNALKHEILKKNIRKNAFTYYLSSSEKIFPADNDLEKYSELIDKFSRERYKLEDKTGEDTFLCRHISDKTRLIARIIHDKLIRPDERRFTFFAVVFILLNLFAILATALIPVIELKKIKSRLLLLFIASSFLPLAAFVGIAFDYIQQYRAARLAEINQHSLKFLQKIDEGSALAYSDQIKTLRKSLPILYKNLKMKGISKSTVTDFLSRQKPELRGIFLNGSQTLEIACEDAILTRDKVIELIENRDGMPFDTDKITQSKAFDVIFKGLLASLNGRPVSSKQGLEMEMVMDSIGQNDHVRLTQSYFESLDSIWKYGFGKDQYPNFITMLREKDYDYNLLAILRESELAEHFARKSVTNLNRNQYDFKIIFKASGENYYPAAIKENQQLKNLLDTSHENSSGRASIIEQNQEKFFVMILHGIHNKNLKMMAMYPLARIDEEIARLTGNFWMTGLLSALTIISLGLLMSGSVVDPVRDLKNAVAAMQNRNFSFQLPDLGQNEFGHLGRIFNRTLGDMQELQVASLVQDKLIPQFPGDQQQGNLIFYGKTESLNDLGGDYFDLIECEDGRMGLLIGDVAGHGVAASLIVAFVKAAVLRLKALYAEPESFFNQLNRLFHQTKGEKQKKFMSLQYVLFNRQNDDFLYLNAGHCFPILVDSTGKTTKFLQMINSPLGTSKKEYANLIRHSLKPGQALVLYSDGYYEMPGMDLEIFQQILLECYDLSPYKYFARVNEYLEQNGFKQETDDKTLLIVMRKIE